MIDSILPVLGLCPTLRIVYVAPLPRAHLTRLHPAFSPFGLPVYLIASPHSIRALQFVQAGGLPTALPWVPVRNWSSLFLNRMLNVVSDP